LDMILFDRYLPGRFFAASEIQTAACLPLMEVNCRLSAVDGS